MSKLIETSNFIGAHVASINVNIGKIKDLKATNRGLEEVVWSTFKEDFLPSVAEGVPSEWAHLNLHYVQLQSVLSGVGTLDKALNKKTDALLFIAKTRPTVLPFLNSLSEAVEFSKVAGHLRETYVTRDALIKDIGEVAFMMGFIRLYSKDKTAIPKTVRTAETLKPFITALATGGKHAALLDVAPLVRAAYKEAAE